MIIAGMATMPDRLSFLKEVVEIVRPQVDVLRVYLNGFVKVPDVLRPEEAMLSSDARGDLGAEGKLYWIDGKDGLDVCACTWHIWVFCGGIGSCRSCFLTEIEITHTSGSQKP